jgi:beta-phosphoglucomutase
MKQNKAVIFDLDGVIVDTAKYHFIAWQEIARQLGINFTEKDNEKLKGVSRVKSLDIILELGNKKLSQAEKDALLEAKNNRYLSLISKMNEDEMLPGIQKLLNDLQNSGMPFALGSASKNARRILNALGITDRFTAIVDGNDVTKAKPDPEVFTTAADKLGVPYEKCIVVEDSQAGIEAAKNGGMKVIGIGDKNILSKADLVLPETGQLTRALFEQL